MDFHLGKAHLGFDGSCFQYITMGLGHEELNRFLSVILAVVTIIAHTIGNVRCCGFLELLSRVKQGICTQIA